VSDDPVRLSAAGSEAPTALRDLLTEARGDVPTAAVLERMAARLPGAPPPVAPAAPTTGAPAVAKLAGALAVVGALVVGGVWLGTRPAPTPPPAPAIPVVTHAPAATAAPSRSPSAEPAPAEGKPTAEPAPEPAKPSGPSEAVLLQRAQAALRSDPARALALTQEHRQRFPRGQLSQEREVIAIEALSRLGRAGEATKRAESFEKSYPGSAHTKKVETSVNPAKP
jgi:hypothetical protein